MTIHDDYPELAATARLPRTIEYFEPSGGASEPVTLKLSVDDANFIRGILLGERNFGLALYDRHNRTVVGSKDAYERNKRLGENIARADRIIRDKL